MKRRISIAIFLSIMSLCSRAQIGGDYNPSNPSDPGTPVQKYTLTLKAVPTEGGSFNSSEIKVAVGERYNLRAYPNSSFDFVAWICNGDTLSRLASYDYVMPAHNEEITGVFAYNPSSPSDPREQPLKHQLSLVAQPVNSGSFNFSNERIEERAITSLHAYANSDFVFRQWMIGDSVLSADPSLNFVMPAHNVQIVGRFEYNPASPANPNANYWNPITGEVIVDDFTPGRLSDAVYYAIAGSNGDDVAMITVAGKINSNDFGIANNFKNCGLLDLSRVTGVTEVPSYAFDYTNLESVYLPATIEKIGYRAFADCPVLSSITLYAMTPPELDNNVFQGVPEGLVVYVPAAAISQYQDADGWKEFTILPIQEDIRNIIVSLPEGSDPADYSQMWLELRNTKNGQRIHFVMTNRMQYTFSNIIRNTEWNVTLRNERGDVFGLIENVEVKEEDVAVVFSELTKPQGISLTLLSPDGRDLTDQAQITWTDMQGNYLSQGPALAGLPTGYGAMYVVTLQKDPAMQYEAPKSAEYVLKDGDNDIVCRLQPIKQIEISGKLKDATTGLPLSGATVSVSQTYAGKYSKTLNGKTDNKGVYTLSIANVPTSVAFSAADYVSGTMVCDSLLTGDSVSLPDMALKPITGATISIGFTYTDVNGDSQDWFSDYQNVDFELFNVTKDRAVSQFNVQYPQIVLLEDIDDGDKLRLTASSRTNAFMPVVSMTTIDEQKADAAFDIVELGQIRASFAKTGNASVVGSLYDASGKLIKTYGYANASLKISDLADGKYSLVTMGSSRLFNSIYDLEQLPQTGLKEGSDYVLSHVDVKSGSVSNIDIEEVPALDESKLYYTGDNTSFTVNKPSIVAGNYLTLTGHIDFKPSYAAGVSNVQMIVDLPEACEFVENSVMVGNNTSSYTLNGNRITIPMTRYSDRVRFCIIPTLGGDYAPSAFAQFDLNDETITQPIGSANYTIKDLSISVPSIVAKTIIPVSGTAIGKSDIEIYDNGVLIGQTTSLANGTWSTTCELNEPYNLSTHEIFANVLTKQGVELKTEIEECSYDMMAIEPKSVTMSFYNGWLNRNVEVVFDFSSNSTSSPSYMFYTKTNVTFVIDFSKNDSTLVSNVNLIVRTDKGNDLKLPATYDQNLCKWVAVKEFGSYELPVNISVDYVSLVDYIGDREYLDSKISSFSGAIDNMKEEVKVLESMLDLNNIEYDNSELYNSIENLISGHDYDMDYLYILLDEYVDGLDNVDDSVEIIENDNLDYLENEFEEWFNEYKTLNIDSLLTEFSIPITIMDFEVPSAPYAYSAIMSENSCLYEVELLSDFNEKKYEEDGFVSLDMTDGKKIFYQITQDEIKVIDSSKMLKYTFSYEINGTGNNRKIVSKEFIEEFAAPFSECLNSVVNGMAELQNDDDSWYGQVERIHSILSFLQCFYDTSYKWVNKKLDKVLNGKINETQTLINARNAEIAQSKSNISVCVKNMKDIDVRNREIDRLLDLYKGNPNYADDVASLMTEKQMLRALKENFDLKILRESAKILKLKNEVAVLNVSLDLFKRSFNLVFKPFSQLPKSLSGATKLEQFSKIGGKLIGGFGVFLEAIALYEDLCDAYEVLYRWVWLKKAIDMKMPCEGDHDKAVQLQEDINRDGKAIFDSLCGVLWAETQALKIDAASLALMEAPYAELALWLVSGALNGYAEIVKNCSIKGEYLNKETNYWQEIGHLQCKKNPDDNEDDDTDGKNGKLKPRHSWPFDPITPIHDPSGYVYEGVTSNRLEGVTATCFYKEEVEDMYGDLHEEIVKWDAEEYAQKNPLFTDENGMYAWDVPQGLWQVKFEKEGYETTQSEWLPVPPPQLEVNIAMKQNRQPVVKTARAYGDAVEMEFDKYMMPESLTTENISVMQNGKPVEGSVQLLNEEAATEGNPETFASKVRFNAAQPFEAQEITLLVNNRVKSYAGVRMQDNFQQTFTIEQEIRRIVCDSVATIGYGEQESVKVSVLPASASKGKTISVKSSSPMILSVDSENVVIDENGSAEILVSGQLPGSAALIFSVEGTDKTAMTIANVKQSVANTVANPKANIASSTIVAKGTEIVLSCDTEGATIYYTLDGSCPCDITDGRKVFDGTPIVITDDTTIKAMAVADGMYDSDVVTFTYYVEGAGVTDASLDESFEIYPLPVREKLNVRAGGKIIRNVVVTSVNGMLVDKTAKEAKEITLDMSNVPAGIYIVNISTDEGAFSRKIYKVR